MLLHMMTIVSFAFRLVSMCAGQISFFLKTLYILLLQPSTVRQEVDPKYRNAFPTRAKCSPIRRSWTLRAPSEHHVDWTIAHCAERCKQK